MPLGETFDEISDARSCQPANRTEAFEREVSTAQANEQIRALYCE